MSKIQYPYIPNSNEKIKQEMLDFIGAESVEEIYSFIPKEVRTPHALNLPNPITSEMELKKYMEGIINKNITCDERANFLGAGCYDHYVPSICDEINTRSEFLTAYSGDTYADHGKSQAFFEFTSMMGELLESDVVSFPTYDGGQAVSTAVMMAKRINGKKEVIIPKTFNPNIFSQMKCYCEGVKFIEVNSLSNGQIDIEDLKTKASSNTSAIVFENPSFLGFIEEKGEAISKILHETGAEVIVYANPSSLGVLTPPSLYGADIVCGDIQPLGIHMSYGSGLGGYLSSRQEEKYVLNYPHHLYSLFENSKGQFGFARALPERTSYYVREEGIEYLGTCVGLWAVTAAVYLAVMGPLGMKELGENILLKNAYARKKLSSLKNAEVLFGASKFFCEFTLDLNKTGKTVEEINKQLLDAGIFGGYDLSKTMPSLGQSMLIATTEKTSFEDIDKLYEALKTIL